MSEKEETNQLPDVLDCLANLSNDEVFTPVRIANEILDKFPQELFRDPETKFLDPVCKSGVFLREITKRLMNGLGNMFPDPRERLDHILHKQVFGIAITELTSLVSRRTLYCTPYPSSKFSISPFRTIDGNIRYKQIPHTFRKGACIYCGVNENAFPNKEDKENHAYEFIHNMEPEKVFKMKFDVIIGNPPYQMEDGGHGKSAIPIYHKFIQKAIEMEPRYVSMIVPSRWMAGGKGLDKFRADMLGDNRISYIHNFEDASECFAGVDIAGGISYFLWDRNKTDPDVKIVTEWKHERTESVRPLLEEGCDVFIRDHHLIPILKKVRAVDDTSFRDIVSPSDPYGLPTDLFAKPDKYGLPPLGETPLEDGLTVYGVINSKRTKRYVPKDYPLSKKGGLDKYKLFVSSATGSAGAYNVKFAAPIVAGPNELCTETYRQVGPFDTEQEAKNCFGYMRTKFFRALFNLRHISQHAPRGVYQHIPLQDFSKPWTDRELYAKYGLSQEDIDYVENNVTGGSDYE